jgi:acyl-coenzyme A thioesterase PaaI-like protein
MLDITKVPFNQLLGIRFSTRPEYILQLDAKTEYTNHLGTIHAAALFALAEGSGAQFMLNEFPSEMIDQVIPVLRKAEVTYKKPSSGIIFSQARLKQGSTDEIVHELMNRKRVLVTTIVELYDEQNSRVFVADFEWFIAFK